MGKKMMANYFMSSILLSIILQNFLASLAHGAKNITTDEDGLLALKIHVISDPRNLLITNWSTSTSVCNWVGITCSTRHGRVIALNLSHMKLKGTIPPHLGNLSFLTFVSFLNNSFYGYLPNELAKLRRMKSFIFAVNHFSGEIPSWIGSFNRLEILRLDSNKFTGYMPTSLFNLSKLYRLDLSKNSLQGHITDEIQNLHSLRLLSLDNNGLSGSIPSVIFNISSLQQVDLSGNGLSGPLPTLHNNLSSLLLLDLGINNLTGDIPSDTFTHFPNLEALSLSQNLFVGSIPASLTGCMQLKVLSLSINHFQGIIPKDMWNLTMLESLYLGLNNFSGTEIPPSIGNLVNLEYLLLKRSGIVGPLPSTIGNLTRLEVLDLSENSLKGTIPDGMGKLANLKTLSLGINWLSGFVPSGIYNTSGMITISLPGNQLSGKLPSSLGSQLPNLKQLLLWRNNFSGPLPVSLSNASQLIDIDLPSNSFFGHIPDELGNLRNLKQLNLMENHLTARSLPSGLSIFSSLTKCKDLRLLSLANNPLSGTLPVSVGNLSLSLEVFVAYTCRLTGTIPEEIGNLSSLTKLDLTKNDLKGTIPTQIGKLKNLQEFSLENNKLEGLLPFGLCDLQNLGNLFLGVNKFIGQIPSCLGNIKSLRILSLESNNLSSTIPSTLWRLEDIIHLNLSFNYLSGSLSVDIGNLKVVILIDLSGNQLSGNIPPIFGNLQALSSISLANNSFEGVIPPSFGDAISLQFLDLSNNSLSGKIPKSFEKLKYLMYFNASFNKLQGEIPDKGPFTKFSAKSFIGNKELCGAAKFQVPPCKITSTQDRSTLDKKLVLRNVFQAVGLTILALAAIIVFFIKFRKRNMRSARKQVSSLATLKRISYLEIEQATNNFNEIYLLGKGSFGSVYKGTLYDGMMVAVKVFNLQTEGVLKSFEAECEILRMIRHRNIVQVITSCCNIDFKALVLRFMPNYSLEKWLYSHNLFLDVLQRLTIMLDVASALEYLHHGYMTPIIHCDLKPNNILLDEDMVAHVSDFGIAKLLGEGQAVVQTITLATVGYMAPEYGSEGVVSTRGDMYSYGILLMETFTRKKPTDEMFDDEMNIKQWVKESLLNGITQIVDTNLLRIDDHHIYSKMDCVSSIMQLALQCSADSPEERLGIKDVLITLSKIKAKYLKDVSHAR